MLLDTHTIIWVLEGDLRLSSVARQLVEDPSIQLFLSLASIWEMSIKEGLGKLGLRSGIQTLVERAVRSGIDVLAIELPHVLAVQHLPPHHGDPFDRPLIAQAKFAGLSLVSRDALFDRYDVSRLW